MTKHHLLRVLTFHIGAGNGLSAAQLAATLDIPERRIRALVSALREDGIAVCAHPQTGYFIAENEEELDRYCCKFLRARALHSLMLESRLRRIPLPDLIGQLRLKT